MLKRLFGTKKDSGEAADSAEVAREEQRLEAETKAADAMKSIRENMDMPLIFVNRMIEDIKVYNLYYDVVIISDVRLPIEIDELKKTFNNVYSIYVVNQFEPSKLTLDEQMHVTETALENYSNFDITIVNDNIEKLDDRVIDFIEGVEK